MTTAANSFEAEVTNDGVPSLVTLRFLDLESDMYIHIVTEHPDDGYGRHDIALTMAEARAVAQGLVGMIR